MEVNKMENQVALLRALKQKHIEYKGRVEPFWMTTWKNTGKITGWVIAALKQQGLIKTNRYNNYKITPAGLKYINDYDKQEKK